ncbi:unnamed protein product [Cuscuta epithymum]|uniref:Uncharacterized protein n=1 Tax=Cuscuta epithymum TaxID=186058 RepID=A0AAV0GGY7_9ASTE|nr:unnamed protein product [Cuscuta epithymum]
MADRVGRRAPPLEWDLEETKSGLGNAGCAWQRRWKDGPTFFSRRLKREPTVLQQNRGSFGCCDRSVLRLHDESKYHRKDCVFKWGSQPQRRGNHSLRIHSRLAKEFSPFSNWDFKGQNQNNSKAGGNLRDSRLKYGHDFTFSQAVNSKDCQCKGLLQGFDARGNKFREDNMFSHRKGLLKGSANLHSRLRKDDYRDRDLDGNQDHKPAFDSATPEYGISIESKEFHFNCFHKSVCISEIKSGFISSFVFDRDNLLWLRDSILKISLDRWVNSRFELGNFIILFDSNYYGGFIRIINKGISSIFVPEGRYGSGFRDFLAGLFKAINLLAGFGRY